MKKYVLSDLKVKAEEVLNQGNPQYCSCEDADSWFDRTYCPEPCGSMHNYCNTCGLVIGHCEWLESSEHPRAKVSVDPEILLEMVEALMRGDNA